MTDRPKPPSLELVERTARDLAQAQLEAYNAHDVEAFVTCYAKDVEARFLGRDELLMCGHEQFRQRYGELFRDCPELHCELISRSITGRFVIDEERIAGRSRDGQVVRATAIYEMRENKIARVWFIKPD